MARALTISCLLASVWLLTSGQTETETIPTIEIEDNGSKSPLTEPLTVSLHSEDQMTEESTSTTTKEITVTPQTASQDTPLYQYRGKDNTICILLQVDAIIAIKYRMSSGEIRVKNVYVPPSLETSGNCNDDSAELNMSWEDFTLTWMFSKTPGNERWYVSSLELKYSETPDLLQNIDKPRGTVHVSTPRSHGNMLYPTPVGKSFSCKQELTVNLTKENEHAGVSVILNNLKLQPFIFKNDDFGTAYECSPGGATFRDETAPIAVGSTLAIVVLLTVTGYGVYRYFKIKKVQYDTME